MDYKFEKKFSEKHLDNFIDSVHKNFAINPHDSYYFNMIDTEWISNQELLLFTSLLYYFREKNIDYSIDFFQKHTFPHNNVRKAYLLVNLWDNWKIYDVIPNYDFEKYLGFRKSLIDRLKIEYDIRLVRSEIYENNNIVTPFQVLPYLYKYSDRDIINHLDEYNSLEKATSDIIRLEGLSHPFLNKSFGSIIIKELYENFLDHFSNSFFKSKINQAFFSLSVKSKIKNTEYSEKDIQGILGKTFREEKLKETKSFFYNKKEGKFKNESYLEFSFLDFGEGIVNTLRENYGNENSDNFILETAFEPTSSKNPINKKHYTENNIPRGLFDIVSVVERYQGLLIVRSNYGKLIFNFSNNESFNSALKQIENNVKSYFPGTLISIYIPALNNGEEFNSSRINPLIDFTNKRTLKIEKEKFINLYPILNKIENKDLGKPLSYQSLIKDLNQEIITNINTINYVNFKGCENFDERLLKKAVFYLLTDYKVNINNNVLIINPPSEIFLENIRNEIFSLNEAIKSFVVQPLPLIYLNKDQILLKWLGISNIEDEKKLNSLLFGEDNYSLVKTDFINPQEIVGQVNYYDIRGNLHSFLPSEDEIVSRLLKEIFQDKDCIKKEGLYLCSGNYYQEEYIQLSNILSDKENSALVANLLYNKIIQVCKKKKIIINECILIGVTSSSGKILEHFKKINSKITDEQIQVIENYSFLNTYTHIKIKKGKNYILVCDAISTGYLTKRIDDLINNSNSNLAVIAVIANLLDNSFEDTFDFMNEYSDRITSLVNYKIKKFRRQELPKNNKQQLKDVIRINPYTNAPITFNLSYDKVLIDNIDFLELLNDKDINIGFKNFNNLIHPYFFNLKSILAEENIKLNISESLNISILKRTFDKIEYNPKNKVKIFYPKNSDIRFLDLDKFKFNILKDSSIEYFELERFSTTGGWKFSHISNHYESIINNNSVLLLDDGSCSGDSLLQMINEVSFYNPISINLVCIIGRVDDHKREFFSKIQSFTENKIPINIYFASYWNIPTFHLYKNPYSDEIKWLEKLLSITNTPSFVEKTAKNILSQIKPKSNENNKDYEYLIPKRNFNSIDEKFPKKEMTIVRDKIGQVVGYRYYKESFNWFNNLISTLEDESIKIAKEKYQNIEIVSMCILYEPYLYDELCKVMPDFRDKMEMFVQVLIFGNPERNFKKIDINKHLFYDWSRCKRDIIHLFFIVFKNEKLITFLNREKVKELFDFANNENNLHYFLYKISLYFINPFNDNIISKLYEILEELYKDEKYNKLMGNFMSFTRTLPNNSDSMRSQITTLKNLYYKHVIAENTHNEKNSFTHNISDIHTMLDDVLSNIYNDTKIEKEIITNIFGLWMRNQFFLESIISFTSGFKEYFSPNSESYIDLILGKDKSLTSYIVKIEEYLKYDLDNWNQGNMTIDDKEWHLVMIDEIRKYIKLIEDDFISENSDYYKLINQETISLDYVIQSINNILREEFKYQETIISNGHKSYLLPKLYFDKTILREIVNNIKRHGFIDNLNLTCTLSIESNRTIINIKNRISPKINKNSTSQGLKFIQRISSSEFFDFDYSCEEKDGIFNQSLVFIYL